MKKIWKFITRPLLSLKRIVRRDISNEEYEIAKIQSNIKKLGWQWKETVFNDDKIDDCMVNFIKDKHPSANYITNKDSIGWGRFPRNHCWREGWNAIQDIESA